MFAPRFSHQEEKRTHCQIFLNYVVTVIYSNSQILKICVYTFTGIYLKGRCLEMVVEIRLYSNEIKKKYRSLYHTGTQFLKYDAGDHCLGSVSS
jgi:hypothetical protein